MSDIPQGRVAVRAALIASATELFAARGPSSVSVRQIAHHAQVNHGLVHRHFGSKRGLLHAVMTDLAARVEKQLGPATENETLKTLLPHLVLRGGPLQAHTRILARTMLDGFGPDDLQNGFPVYQRMLAAARRAPVPGVSPETVVAMATSTGLGLFVFTPWIRAASALSEEDWRATRSAVFGLIRTAIDASAQPAHKRTT